MPQTLNGEEFYDVDEVITLLGVKKATLYAYVSRGVLRSYRQQVGRGRLYRRAEVDALLRVSPTAVGEDQVQRDVSLPEAASWVGEH